ncbi:MAG: hypothetical protein P8100_06675 [bacterium]
MKRSLMKKFWYDEYSGGFNWALLAIIAFVGIFIFNVITTEVVVPEKTESSINSEKQDTKNDKNTNERKEENSVIKLPVEHMRLNI